MWFLAVLVLVLETAPAFGQTNSGEMAGVVLDASGGVVPGATVTARHLDTGTVVERVTDGEGRFFLPALRIGQWDVTATLAGFAPQTQNGHRAEIGRTRGARVHARRRGTRPSRSSSQPHAPLLQSRDGGDQRRHREPRGRPAAAERTKFLSLAQLSDAVVMPPGGTRGEALQQAGPLPNVGGQRSGHNIYLLDGTKVTDELFNNLVINPSIDSIEEFKIQKSHVPGRVRRQGVGPDQRLDQGRLERLPRQRLRVPSQRRIRRARTTSIRRTSRSRRCARTSTAARSAGRWRETARSSSAATKARGCADR